MSQQEYKTIKVERLIRDKLMEIKESIENDAKQIAKVDVNVTISDVIKRLIDESPWKEES